MALPGEDCVKDVWFAMWEVATHARREKVPGPLQALGKLANSCFEIWFTKPDALRLYAEKVLADRSTCRPREAANKLASACTRDVRSWDTAQACIRLISLLEKAAMDG